MTEHCKSCSELGLAMDTLTIEKELKNIEGWAFNAEKNCITRAFTFKGFAKTMGFINAIAWISQVEKHHPDITFGYNYATVSYQTHEAGGITENDIICAKKINTLL